MGEFTSWALGLARDHAEWAAVIALCLAFAESFAVISLLVPFASALVAFGAVAGSGGIDLMLIWIAASSGAALGDWASYWLGWRFKHRIRHVWPLSLQPRLFGRARAFFKRWGAWAIVIGRFFGPFRATVPIAAGVSNMPWLQFQIANWASAFLWAGLLLTPGLAASIWLAS
ncbi:DedA family protein [Terrarubrum flagellatum]|uniref:DedA family protein n=1 Tax=Terrirubrum flagellatum TaxID=2895980 RepID=UPI0031453867